MILDLWGIWGSGFKDFRCLVVFCHMLYPLGEPYGNERQKRVPYFLQVGAAMPPSTYKQGLGCSARLVMRRWLRLTAKYLQPRWSWVFASSGESHAWDWMQLLAYLRGLAYVAKPQQQMAVLASISCPKPTCLELPSQAPALPAVCWRGFPVASPLA